MGNKLLTGASKPCSCHLKNRSKLPPSVRSGRLLEAAATFSLVSPSLPPGNRESLRLMFSLSRMTLKPSQSGGGGWLSVTAARAQRVISTGAPLAPLAAVPPAAPLAPLAAVPPAVFPPAPACPAGLPAVLSPQA